MISGDASSAALPEPASFDLPWRLLPGNRVEVGPATARILGWDAGNGTGSFEKFVPPEDQCAFRDAADRAVSGPYPVVVTHRVLTANGALRWFSTHLVADEDAVVANSRDISAERRNQELLAAQLDLLRAVGRDAPADMIAGRVADLVHGAGDACLVYLRDRQHVLRCQAARGVTSGQQQVLDSLPADPLAGGRVDLLAVATIALDAGLPDARVLQASDDGALVVGGRHAASHMDGAVRVAAEVLAAVATRERARTDLMEAENRWRAVFSVSPFGLLVTDSDGRVVEMSTAVQTVLPNDEADPDRHLPEPARTSIERLVVDARRKGAPVSARLPIESSQGRVVGVTATPIDADVAPEGLVVVHVTDVTREELAHEEVTGLNRQLRDVNIRLTLARESERAELARGLHDNPVQTLVAAKWCIEDLFVDIEGDDAAPTLDTGVIRDHAQRTAEHIDAALQELRDLTFELRPPALQRGMVDAVRWTCTSMLGDSYDWDITGDVDATLSEVTEAIVFRTVQEAIRNVVRHAEADTVRISFAVADETLFVTVRDDGKGVDPGRFERAMREGHYGVASMRNTIVSVGGRFDIHPETPGTSVRFAVPIAGPAVP